MQKHPDQRFRAYIVDGIYYGFWVGLDYNRTCRKSHHDMSSALEKPEVVREYLAKECSEGRVLGHLIHPFFLTYPLVALVSFPKGRQESGD